ncbi:hypothetical protein LEP1GSC163_1453 [Leptospira santarosai str. CBC379]|nr:hypothetical protein LEP1GSC163_1453 [Leptospira santarosai str. CBC379]
MFLNFLCSLKDVFFAKETTNADWPTLRATTTLLPVPENRCCQAVSIKILRSRGLPVFAKP